MAKLPPSWKAPLPSNPQCKECGDTLESFAKGILCPDCGAIVKGNRTQKTIVERLEESARTFGDCAVGNLLLAAATEIRALIYDNDRMYKILTAEVNRPADNATGTHEGTGMLNAKQCTSAACWCRIPADETAACICGHNHAAHGYGVGERGSYCRNCICHKWQPENGT